jgi:hypothetical protein
MEYLIQLDDRAGKWLINEANLVFYIDQSAMANANYEPQRVYFDLIRQKNKPLLDFYTEIFQLWYFCKI